jgi:hypothetical protein
MAGIKLHAAIDTRIAGNHIHDCVRGIWLDWQGQGARVQGNLCHDNGTEDFYIEVCHGPAIVDHNCLLSPMAVKNCSQGTAFVHNLIAGGVAVQAIPNRYTPYHLPHSTQVMGLMTILGGDDRWLNNLFLAPQALRSSVEVEDENADLAGGPPGASPFGLACYDDWPSPDEDWVPQGSVPAYASARLPVYLAGNVFTEGTRPGRHASGLAVEARPVWRLQQGDGHIRLMLEGLASLPTVPTLARGVLGSGFQAEYPFQDPLGSLVDWRLDVNQEPRGETCLPGPARDLPRFSWPWRMVPES